MEIRRPGVYSELHLQKEVEASVGYMKLSKWGRLREASIET